MRKIRISVIAVVVTFLSFLAEKSFSQIGAIKVSDKITIDTLYLGMLGGASFNIDSLHNTQLASVRFGTIATYQMNKWLAMKSCMAIQSDETGKPFIVDQFFFRITPTKKLMINVGNMSTLVSEQRPNPATADGQFETWAQSKIIGMSLGAKAFYSFSKKYGVGIAVANRNNKPEYQFAVKLNKLTASAYYDDYNKKYNVVMTTKIKRVDETFVWRQDNVIANLLCIDLGRDWSFYNDFGYDLIKKEVVREEAGFLKSFEKQITGKIYLRGLIGPGYCYETRTINGYLFIHL